ncbi:hypothetical protein LTR05_000891 [Lithohypha guttulata]|uniref:MARVEL domain-containing protein n=1 Tax=Lithohypha guttulata TaxID=1690604 RepID=A0AAN7TD22_9EURO|nr:hypothetical protein LTR05_000891 [Lithohypha guttulata]
MGYRDASNKQRIVVFVNTVIRLVQAIVSVVALGLYAAQQPIFLQGEIAWRIDCNLAFAGAAFVTALVFLLIPILVSYRLVAQLAPWDFVVLILWAAGFGLTRWTFYTKYDNLPSYGLRCPVIIQPICSLLAAHWDAMVDASWTNITGLCLSAISGTMGVLLLWMGSTSVSSSTKNLV